MSYAIIRHEMYKNNLNVLTNIYKHNSRLKERYSNRNINKSYSHYNYYLKQADCSYYKSIKSVIEDKNIESHIQKKSNVLGEFLITSDNNFFKTMNMYEQKVFFDTAYEFVCNKIGEKNILNATVHFDEDTPHMHVDYIPIVKDGEKKKLSSRAIWKGKNTYHQLQEDYYNYMVREKKYNLERGEVGSVTKHLSVSELKDLTEYEDNSKKRNDINNKYWNKELKSSKEIVTGKDKLIENSNAFKKGTYEKNDVDKLVVKYESEVKELSKQSDEKDEIIKDLTKEITGISKERVFEKATRLEKDIEKLRIENNHLRKSFDILLESFENFKKLVLNIPLVRKIIDKLIVNNKSDITQENEIMYEYVQTKVKDQDIEKIEKINKEYKNITGSQNQNELENEQDIELEM